MSKYSLLLLALVVSCNTNKQSKTNSTNAKAGLAGSSELDGTWLTDCVEISGGWRQQQKVTFSNSIKRSERITYLDECKTPVSSETVEAEFALAGQTYPKKIDETLKGATLKPITPEMAALMNEMEMHEMKDWQAGVEKNILNTKLSKTATSQIYSEGHKQYNIFQVENNHLYFGSYSSEDKDGESESNRPAKLMDRAYSKQ